MLCLGPAVGTLAFLAGPPGEKRGQSEEEWEEVRQWSHQALGRALPDPVKGIELGVYLAPGGQAKPSCLPPEGNVIRHASREVVLCIACGDEVEVCHEIRGPLWLVRG